MDSDTEAAFRDYALRYLLHHSGQRSQNLRFFSAMGGGLTAISFYLLRQEPWPWLTISSGALLTLLSLLFWQLDYRLQRSARDAEAALRHLDAQHGFAEPDGERPHVLRLMDCRNLRPTKSSLLPFGDGGLGESQAIRLCYALFAAMGLYLVAIVIFVPPPAVVRVATPAKSSSVSQTAALPEGLRPLAIPGAHTPYPQGVPHSTLNGPQLPAPRIAPTPFKLPARPMPGTPVSMYPPAGPNINGPRSSYPQTRLPDPANQQPHPILPKAAAIPAAGGPPRVTVPVGTPAPSAPVPANPPPAAEAGTAPPPAAKGASEPAGKAQGVERPK